MKIFGGTSAVMVQVEKVKAERFPEIGVRWKLMEGARVPKMRGD